MVGDITNKVFFPANFSHASYDLCNLKDLDDICFKIWHDKHEKSYGT